MKEDGSVPGDYWIEVAEKKDDGSFFCKELGPDTTPPAPARAYK